MQKTFTTLPRICTLLLSTMPLLACTAISTSDSEQTIDALTQAYTAQAVSWQRDEAALGVARGQVQAQLAQPLSAEAAVKIALLNSPSLQAALAELQIARADVAQASRLKNPGFTFTATRKGDEREIERLLSVDVLGLFTLPLRVQAQQRALEQTQRSAAQSVLHTASVARKAWVNAVAAAQTLAYMQQVMDAAYAASTLALGMQQAGNYSKLQAAREQAFQADAAALLARARQSHASARENLVRALGLDAAQAAQLRLPDRLPELPVAPREWGDVAQQSLQQRLDVQAAQLYADGTARNLGLVRISRFVNVLETGAVNTSSWTAGVRDPNKTGYEIVLEVPLFDWGSARVAKAEAIYLQSVQQLRATVLNAQSEVREAHEAYRNSFGIAAHYRDEILPRRKLIGDELLLRYNGMLASVFELLADAREQVMSVNAAQDAQRDFWLADADLQAAISGAAPLGSRAMAAAPAAMPPHAKDH